MGDATALPFAIDRPEPFRLVRDHPPCYGEVRRAVDERRPRAAAAGAG